MILTKKKDIYVLPIKKIKYIICGNIIIDITQRHSIYRFFVNFIINNPYILLKTNIFGPPSSLIISKKYKQQYNKRLKYLIDVEYYVELLKYIEIKNIFLYKNKEIEILSSQNNKESITNSLGIKKNIIHKKEKFYLERKYKINYSFLKFLSKNIFHILFKIRTTFSIRFTFRKER